MNDVITNLLWGGDGGAVLYAANITHTNTHPILHPSPPTHTENGAVMHCDAIKKEHDGAHQHVLLIELVSNYLEFLADLSLYAVRRPSERLIFRKHGVLNTVRTSRRRQQ